MRLLPKKEVVDIKKASESKIIEIAEKRRKVIQGEYQKLKRYEELLELETKNKTETFFALSKELEGKSRGLANEVKKLEAEKAEVLKPIDLKEKEFAKREQEILDSKNNLLEIEKGLNKKETELIKDRKVLEDLKSQLEQIKVQLSENEAVIKERSELLKEKELKYITRVSKLTLAEEKLVLHTIDVKNQESALDSKLETIKRKEDFVNKQLKLIESRQAQMRAAYEEMKKYAK